MRESCDSDASLHFLFNILSSASYMLTVALIYNVSYSGSDVVGEQLSADDTKYTASNGRTVCRSLTRMKGVVIERP